MQHQRQITAAIDPRPQIAAEVDALTAQRTELVANIQRQLRGLQGIQRTAAERKLMQPAFEIDAEVRKLRAQAIEVSAKEAAREVLARNNTPEAKLLRKQDMIDRRKRERAEMIANYKAMHGQFDPENLCSDCGGRGHQPYEYERGKYCLDNCSRCQGSGLRTFVSGVSQ